MLEDQNKKYWFNPINKESLIEVFKSKLSSSDQKIILWEQDKGEKSAQNFSIVNFCPRKISFELKFTGTLLERFIGTSFESNKVEKKQLLYKLELENKTYFGTGIFENSQNNYGHFDFFIEDKNYETQQRSNYRIKSSRSLKIQTRINNEVFEVYDLSASGLSIYLPQKLPGYLLESEGSSSQESLMNSSLNVSSPRKKLFFDIKVSLAQNVYKIPTISHVKTFTIQKFEDNTKKDFQIMAFEFQDLPIEIEKKLSLDISLHARGEEIVKSLLKGK